MFNVQARCPKDESHQEFVTVAHITQDWKVDEKGNFLEVAEDCLEVTHGPDRDNIWSCHICGAEAIVE